MIETYRRDRSWEWNLAHGPSYDGPWPAVPEGSSEEFLGFRVSSRIGIAAGLLLDSKWIECYARLGFDLLTYKTVRSSARPCPPPPNWVYVHAEGGIEDPERPLVARDDLPRDPSRVSSAVCFGMPSQDPSAWTADVRTARKRLPAGKVLIVSVVGTPRDEGGLDSLVEDFVRTARLAAEAGAHVVEANFSCPNVCSAEGRVDRDPRVSGLLAGALRDALPSTPLLVKAGDSEDPREREDLLEAIHRHVDGVLLVNGVARRVVDSHGRPVFGTMERVGVLGHAIHGRALAAVRHAVAWVRARGSRLLVLGVGGISDPADSSSFFENGAHAALLGGLPMFDPEFAIRTKAHLAERRRTRSSRRSRDGEAS